MRCVFPYFKNDSFHIQIQHVVAPILLMLISFIHTLHDAALNLLCIWDRHLYSGFSSHLILKEEFPAILWQKLQHAVFECGSFQKWRYNFDIKHGKKPLFFHKLYRHRTGFSEYVLRRYDSKQMALGEPKHALWQSLDTLPPLLLMLISFIHTLLDAALNLFCIWDRHLYSGFSSHLILKEEFPAILWQKKIIGGVCGNNRFHKSGDIILTLNMVKSYFSFTSYTDIVQIFQNF
jgi:hypothetical protein